MTATLAAELANRFLVINNIQGAIITGVSENEDKTGENGIVLFQGADFLVHYKFDNYDNIDVLPTIVCVDINARRCWHAVENRSESIYISL